MSKVFSLLPPLHGGKLKWTLLDDTAGLRLQRNCLLQFLDSLILCGKLSSYASVYCIWQIVAGFLFPWLALYTLSSFHPFESLYGMSVIASGFFFFNLIGSWSLSMCHTFGGTGGLIDKWLHSSLTPSACTSTTASITLSMSNFCSTICSCLPSSSVHFLSYFSAS